MALLCFGKFPGVVWVHLPFYKELWTPKFFKSHAMAFTVKPFEHQREILEPFVRQRSPPPSMKQQLKEYLLVNLVDPSSTNPIVPIVSMLSCSGGMWWPNTLLKHFMLGFFFPLLICHPSVYYHIPNYFLHFIIIQQQLTFIMTWGWINLNFDTVLYFVLCVEQLSNAQNHFWMF